MKGLSISGKVSKHQQNKVAIVGKIGVSKTLCLYIIKDHERVYKHICLRKVFSKLSQYDQALKLDQISPFGVYYMFMLESELSSLPYDP